VERAPRGTARLLYSGWLKDNRRDQLKLHRILAIVEGAHDGAGR
jgi:hypothetical protein